jgi:hypothetical protein
MLPGQSGECSNAPTEKEERTTKGRKYSLSSERNQLLSQKADNSNHFFFLLRESLRGKISDFLLSFARLFPGRRIVHPIVLKMRCFQIALQWRRA